MSENENKESGSSDAEKIRRLERRSHELFQRVIDLERKLRATNDRVNSIRNSFAVIYGVIIVLVVAAGVRWLM